MAALPSGAVFPLQPPLGLGHGPRLVGFGAADALGGFGAADALGGFGAADALGGFGAEFARWGLVLPDPQSLPSSNLLAGLPAERRPPRLASREWLAQGGVEGLGDAELLALILSTGTCGESALVLAARLLADAGDLGGVVNKGFHELELLRGVGPAKAARLVAAFELGRRAIRAGLAGESPSLTTLSAVEAWARPRLALLEHEELWVLSVDARRRLRRAQRVAQGGLHGCALTPADILKSALRAAASGFVLVHNHPSGDPTPSESDRRATRALQRACDAVGIPLLDHVVVARAGAASALDSVR